MFFLIINVQLYDNYMFKTKKEGDKRTLPLIFCSGRQRVNR